MWLVLDADGLSGEIDLSKYVNEGWVVLDIRVIGIHGNKLRLFVLFGLREE